MNRAPLLLSALLFACAGSRVETRASSRTSPTERSASNPEGQTTEYSTTLSADEPAKPPPPASEGPTLLASDANGYFWVRAEDGGFVRAIGSDRRWQAPVYEVERATKSNVKAGDRLFVARVSPGKSGASAAWEVGTVERVDGLFDKAYVNGQVYDLAREVLRPKQELLENTPVR